jgi:hypothetical protein
MGDTRELSILSGVRLTTCRQAQDIDSTCVISILCTKTSNIQACGHCVTHYIRSKGCAQWHQDAVNLHMPSMAEKCLRQPNKEVAEGRRTSLHLRRAFFNNSISAPQYQCTPCGVAGADVRNVDQSATDTLRQLSSTNAMKQSTMSPRGGLVRAIAAQRPEPSVTRAIVRLAKALEDLPTRGQRAPPKYAGLERLTRES